MTPNRSHLFGDDSRTPRVFPLFVVIVMLHLAQINRALAEDQFGYRFQYYQEEDQRVRVETHTSLLDYSPTPWLAVKGQMVYDAISGATPTGAPPPSELRVVNILTGQPLRGNFSRKVPMVELTDERWAGTFDPTISLGRHRFTPAFSYSEESDYISYGGALNYSVDFNDKNTTLNLGWARNWDEVLRSKTWESKETEDFLAGINQLLGPQTVLAANFTYGTAHGYLADPYKGVLFDGRVIYRLPNDPTPLVPSVDPEKRPHYRDRYVGYVSLTQFLKPVNASVEGSYRISEDSYGVESHTVGLAWFQKIGRRVVISPLFRYSHQSAADFYVSRLPGVPTSASTPDFYSADYRLSKMETFTYGVNVTVQVTDWFSVDAGYKRYEMFGLDGATSASAYPKANVFTIGGRLWF